MGAQAADWPARPVTVIVGYAAGGNTDVMARMASRTLSEEFRQSFVVDNRIGAGGALAAAYVAQAALTATRCSSPPLRRLP
jgi:tripartite-type tricarboxylate transporter receptor subunit TctC